MVVVTRPDCDLYKKITALDFQPGPLTSTPLGTLVTEEVVLDLDNCTAIDAFLQKDFDY